jgi:hypothetical protein
MDLLKISEKRRKIAFEIIKRLELEEILRETGQPYLVGSVSLNTVIKRDIDFHIHLDKEVSPKKAVDYVKEKLSKKVKNIKIKSYEHLSGLVMGFDYSYMGKWAIDLFFCTEKPDSAEHDRWIKPLLTEEKRRVIIQLKYYYLKRKLLRMGMSYNIYEGVLKNKVDTPEKFETFLEGKGLSLDYFRKRQGKKED